MIWSDNLYVGDAAEAVRSDIIKDIKRNKPRLGVFILCAPLGERNVLDIYPAIILTQKHFDTDELYIVGIALGYNEALDVMQKLVMDVYKNTGTFDVRKV